MKVKIQFESKDIVIEVPDIKVGDIVTLPDVQRSDTIVERTFKRFLRNGTQIRKPVPYNGLTKQIYDLMHESQTRDEGLPKLDENDYFSLHHVMMVSEVTPNSDGTHSVKVIEANSPNIPVQNDTTKPIVERDLSHALTRSDYINTSISQLISGQEAKPHYALIPSFDIHRVYEATDAERQVAVNEFKSMKERGVSAPAFNPSMYLHRINKDRPHLDCCQSVYAAYAAAGVDAYDQTNPHVVVPHEIYFSRKATHVVHAELQYSQISNDHQAKQWIYQTSTPENMELLKESISYWFNAFKKGEDIHNTYCSQKIVKLLNAYNELHEDNVDFGTLIPLFPDWIINKDVKDKLLAKFRQTKEQGKQIAVGNYFSFAYTNNGGEKVLISVKLPDGYTKTYTDSRDQENKVYKIRYNANGRMSSRSAISHTTPEMRKLLILRRWKHYLQEGRAIDLKKASNSWFKWSRERHNKHAAAKAQSITDTQGKINDIKANRKAQRTH